MTVVADDDVGVRVVAAGVDDVAAEAAEDEIRARTRGDGVGPAADAVGDDLQTDSACERDPAVVAEHDVGTSAGDDRVVARTAEHDVVAVARRESIGAGSGRVGRDDEGAQTSLELGVAAIAEDDVVAAQRRHRVAARARDDDVVARADVDRVVAAEAEIEALGPLHTAISLEGGASFVAEHHVVAGKRGDRVGAGAADDDVVAAADLDGVVVAETRIEALGPLHPAQGIELDGAVVAEDDVGIRVGLARVDGVATATAEHHVGARAGRDGVGRTALAAARHLEADSACEGHAAVVAQHDVRAVPRDDGVGARAAEDQVGARAGLDLVVAAQRRVERLGEPDAAEGVEGDVAVVAEDDVVVRIGLARIDEVAAEAADDEVGARARGDHVAAAAASPLAEGLQPDAVQDVDGAVVAEDNVGTDAGGNGVVARAAENDVVAVARADRVVARHALVLGGGAHEDALREGREAVVAEDHVAPSARGDVVGADAAEHHVVALARHDPVAAAEGRVRGLDRDQDAVREHGAAVVAEDHVRAGAGADLVRADAADDDAAAVAEGDEVAQARRGGGGRSLEDATLRVEGRLAVVAEHRAAAVAGGDGVAARTAEDHGDAVADADRVVAADIVVGRLDQGRQAGRGEAGVARIADDHVGAGADLRAVADPGRDGVAAGTAEDRVAAAADSDGVAVADLGADARDLDEDASLEIGLAAVAEHDIVAVADGDRVAARTAQDDVVAVADGNGVVAADGRGDRERTLDPAGGVEGDDAVVAQDHRAPVGAGDGVAARATEHDVAAGAEADRVGAADGGRGGGDAREHARRHGTRRRHGEVGLAAVAEDDVVARAGGDPVGPRTADDPGLAVLGLDDVVTADLRRDRLDALGSAVAERRPAAVAEDHVVARANLDRVGPRAAEDGGIAAGRRDRVVAADLGRDREDRGDGAIDEGGRAAVAEHDLRALAERDPVGARAADHRGVAVLGLDDVVAADARIDALDRDELADPEDGFAAVAEDDVVARADRDTVGAGPAEDGGVAVARRDRVAAADLGRDRGHGGDPAVLEGRRAAVAEHDLHALAERDPVGARAADDGRIAVLGLDDVVAADARIDALDRGETAGVEQRPAAIAEDDVVARADLDRVRARAADDGGVALDRGDRVVATDRRGQRGDRRDPAVDEGGRAAVAEHDLPAIAERDPVGARAADDGDVAVPGLDAVVAADRRLVVRGLDGDQDRNGHAADGAGAGGEARLAGIAEDHVRAGADGDAVLARAADDGGVAVASLDRVVAAGRAGDAAQARQHAAREHRLAVVAEDDVVAGARGDRVGAEAADDHVVAVGRNDRVGAADARMRRDHAGDDVVAGERDTRGLRAVLIDLAVIAEDDVVAALGVDGVGPLGAVLLDERIGNRHDALHVVEVEARIAEDDVGARPALDPVVAGAAGDEVATLAALDRVVAGAAVDDDETGRARRVDDVVEADAGAVDIDRALVAEADGAAGPDAVRGAVAAAVGAGVAEQGERALRRLDGDRVGTAAAVDRGQRLERRALHGDPVGARAEQQLHRGHVAIGDAALEGHVGGAAARGGGDVPLRHPEAGDVVGVHHAVHAHGGGVVEQRDLVEVLLGRIDVDVARDRAVGLAGQDDRRGQRAAVGADAADQDQRALDAAEVVRLAREGLEVRDHLGGVRVAQHLHPHGLIEVRRVEGDRRRCRGGRPREARIVAVGEGLAVARQRDGHRSPRRGRQDHVVVGRLARRHHDAALGRGHDDTRRIAVRHLDAHHRLADECRREEALRAGAGDGALHDVGDLRQVTVLGRAVGRRRDEHRLRLVPVARIEGEDGEAVRVGGQGVAGGVGEDELRQPLSRHAEGDGDRLPRERRVVEDDGVAVPVLRLGCPARTRLDDRGAAAALDDDQARLVVVDDLDQRRADVGAAHLRVGADDRVADGHALLALGGRVRLGANEDRLRPLGLPDVDPVLEFRGEAERQGVGPGDAVDRDLDRARGSGERPHLAGGLRGGHGEDRPVIRAERSPGRGRRRDRVGADAAALDAERRDPGILAQGQAARVADAATGGGCDGGVDARHEQAVVARIGARRGVVDDRRVALGVARHDLAADIAGDVERVAAQAADQGGDDARRRGEDVEGVVALQAVDLHCLDVAEADRQAGTVDAVAGHDEGVGEFGAERDDLVEARTAVDLERRVDVVLDPVVAGAGIELDLVVLRVGSGQREGAHDEGVVAVLAFEAQVRLVRVDLEGVVAGAAVDHRRQRDAAG